MARYLIEVNLPYHFSLWLGTDYEHVRDLNDAWTDRQIWEYARFHQALARHWPWIMRNIPRFRLIRVYPQHVEGVSDAS